MTAAEIGEALDEPLSGLYVRLHRMVERRWLDKEGVTYRVTDLGKIAQQYGRTERA